METEITGVAKVIVLPDMHVDAPGHGDLDEAAFELLTEYMGTQRWDAVVQLGDFLDLGSISHHNRGRPGAVGGATIRGALDAGAEAVATIKSAARANNPKCQFYWLQGNHEDRWGRYLEEHPELSQIISLPKELGQEEDCDHIYECYPKGVDLRLGKLYYTHGFFHGVNHARDHARAYGADVIYGHIHTHQTFTVETVAHGVTHAWCGGTLTRRRPHYARSGRPTAWQTGFIEVHYGRDDLYAVYQVPIHPHGFVAPGCCITTR